MTTNLITLINIGIILLTQRMDILDQEDTIIFLK